jgi:RimJ/RimL family protein N-acetyltransferase
LSYGFQMAALARIWARTDPPNVASIAVIERLGMDCFAGMHASGYDTFGPAILLSATRRNIRRCLAATCG